MNQQIYDVLPNRPFGRGSTNSTITSNPNTRTWASSSGANITLGSAILADGDLAMIHQSYGTAGATTENWEVFVVSSGGGTVNIVATGALGRTYNTGAQVVKIPEYRDLTVSSGFSGGAWGSTINSTENQAKKEIGGINAVAVSNVLTLNANISQNGYEGYYSTSDCSGRNGNNGGYFSYWWYANAPAGGFCGGWNTQDNNIAGVGGNWAEGYTGREQRQAYGNGGGGAGDYQTAGCGGNGTAGTSDTCGGGDVAGNAALTSMFFGGAGGGAGRETPSDPIWTGGSGGGIWLIFAKYVVFGASGSITANGGTGYANINCEAGSGAGGSILINCQTGAFGTNKVTATPGTAYGNLTAGTGRIRINYGTTITGTTNPTMSSAQNSLLIDNPGASFLFNLL